jgi:PAS domain S-box-containing protein
MHRAEERAALGAPLVRVAPGVETWKCSQDAIGVFGFELGADFVTSCGEGFRALFGLEAGVRFDWETWSARLHPEDRERVFADFARLLTAGGSAPIEFRVVRGGDAPRRVLTRARSIASRDAACKVSGVAVDVSELETPDSPVALRGPGRAPGGRSLDTEGVLRALGAVSPDLMFARDLEGRVLYANAATLDLLGRPEREVVGRTAFELFEDPARAEAITRDDERVAHLGRSETIEEEFVHARQGETRVYLSTRSPLRDQASGRVIGVVSVGRDVTGARRAERALAESEAKLRLIVDRVPASLAIFDAEMRYLALSRRFVQDHGLEVADPDDLVGRSHYEVFPNLPERYRELHRRVLSGETVSADRDSYVRDDGRAEWVRWEMAPWRRADGEIGGLILFSEIITARTEADAVLSRDRAELERLVQERSDDLQRTQARLAQAEKLTALGQLAGGIAHDFNNVMQAVQGGASLIMRRCDDPAQVIRLAGMIEDAARRASGITRRLLAFSRKSALSPEPIDARAVLEGLSELLTHTFPAGVDVVLAAGPGLPLLTADRSELETVLVNLATNARDAMPGGGRLTFSAQAETVRPEQAQAMDLPAGAYVRIEVADTGAGMDETTLARALEPFFTTKPLGAGTGLGLPMARRFAEQSGGRLALESRPGKGTKVALWLPEAKAAPDGLGADSRRRGLRAARTDPEHVLIVDDEDAVRDVLATQLAEYGYVVHRAKTGALALERLDGDARVDLIVSDLAMPGMDGVAVIEAARTRRPGLPAILLTGFAGEAAALAESCPFKLMRKPVSGEQLAASVAELLERTRAARPAQTLAPASWLQ